MRLIAVFLLSLSLVIAGGSHGHHGHHKGHDHHKDDHHSHGDHRGPDHHKHDDHSHKDHDHSHAEEVEVHNALLSYHCAKYKFDWKQLSNEEKKCPICPSSESKCGKLVQVLPKKEKSYPIEQRLLPNNFCPVSKKKVNREFSTKYKGKKIYFHNPLNRDLFNKDPENYIKSLELNPANLGTLIKTHKSHLKSKVNK